MKNSSKLNIDLNSKNNTRDGNPGAYNLRSISDGWTAFHFTCFFGHSDIAEMIMKNSSQLKIDLNSKDSDGWTAFHFACMSGHIRIVDMMIELSESLELDLKAEDKHGRTGYKLAKEFRKTDVVNLIRTKMPCLAM